MREYKFRGKRKDGKGWSYGDLLHYDGKVFVGLEDAWLDECEVDPATVGMCTGLKDRLGREIFEGDIVFDSDWECIGKVFYSSEHLSWMVRLDGESEFLQEFICADTVKTESSEVIGNIHDNPELMEVPDER
ncbi:MAG TPA: YopX family protein [Clostridia bacterium]|nr:YopX family protein [Clostridia bacterium]